jgi:hypothetical protein
VGFFWVSDAISHSHQEVSAAVMSTGLRVGLGNEREKDKNQALPPEPGTQGRGAKI